MGKGRDEMADKVFLTSDNPRSESPTTILSDIVGGIKAGADYTIEPDRRGAIKLALQCAQKDDVVLIAGKGHETYQIFRDKTVGFDDRQIAREILGSSPRSRRPKTESRMTNRESRKKEKRSTGVDGRPRSYGMKMVPPEGRRGEGKKDMVGGTHIYGGFNLSPYLALRVFEAVQEITAGNLNVSLSHVDDDKLRDLSNRQGEGAGE